MPTGSLHVNVAEAKNLPPGGLFKLDPYVKLTVGFWKRSTAVSKSGDASPSWHQELLFPISSGNTALEITVLNKKSVGSDDEVGLAVFDLARRVLAPPFERIEEWVELHGERGPGQPAGSIRLVMQFELEEGAGSVMVPHRRLADGQSAAWHAVGFADNNERIEEDFVLKIEGGETSGSQIPGSGEHFTIAHGTITGDVISFVQSYPDGADTHWRAVLNAGHDAMSEGVWTGACNGTFTAARETVAEAQAHVAAPHHRMHTVANEGGSTESDPMKALEDELKRSQALRNGAGAPPVPQAEPGSPAEKVQQALQMQSRVSELSQALAAAMLQKREAAEKQQTANSEHSRLEAQMSAIGDSPDGQLRQGINGDVVRISKRAIGRQNGEADPLRNGRPSSPSNGGAGRTRSRSPNPTPRGFGSSSPSRVGGARNSPGRQVGFGSSSPSRTTRAGARGGSPANTSGGSPGNVPRVANLLQHSSPSRRRQAASSSPSAVGFGSSSRSRTRGASPGRQLQQRASSPGQRASSPGFGSSSSRALAGRWGRGTSPGRAGSVGGGGGGGGGTEALLPRVARMGPRERNQARANSARRAKSPVPKAFGSGAPRMSPYGPFDPRETTPGSNRAHSAIRSNSAMRMGSPGAGGPGAGGLRSYGGEDPIVGTSVLARFSEDGQWKDAVVRRSLQGGAKYLVFFKKYNKSETVPREAIVELGHRNPSSSLSRSPVSGGGRQLRSGRGDSPGRPGSVGRGSPRSPRGGPVGRSGADPLLQVLETELQRSAALRNGNAGSPDGARARYNRDDGLSPRHAVYEPPGQHHLDDVAMQRFIAEGFISVKTDSTLKASFHQKVYSRCSSLQLHRSEHNTGNNVLAAVPELSDVFEQQDVRGALESILGREYMMHGFRECISTDSTQEELWNRDVNGNTFQRRQHRPRWATALYYPHATTIELGGTEIMVGSQYCGILDHRALLQRARSTDGSIKDQLAPGLQPAAWGRSRQITVEAGTVLIMHHDLWHRQLSNVAAESNVFIFKMHFVRMQEPIPGAQPAWRHSTREWLLPTQAPDLPNLRILWESVWRWYCGVADTTLLKGQNGNPNGNEQTVQTLLRRLGWETGEMPVIEPAVSLEEKLIPGKQHSVAVIEKLTNAQAEHKKSEVRLAEYQMMVDNLLLQLKEARSGGDFSGNPGGQGQYDPHDLEMIPRQRQKAAVEQIMALQEEMARQDATLKEQKAKESRERERTKTAKAEAIRLRRELSQSESGLKKLSRKHDSAKEKQLQLQNRLTTVATAARTGKEWNPSWDKWVPGLETREEDMLAKDPWAKRYLAQMEASKSPDPTHSSSSGLDSPAANRPVDGFCAWGDDSPQSDMGGWGQSPKDPMAAATDHGMDGPAGPEVMGGRLGGGLGGGMGNMELEVDLQVQQGVTEQLDLIKGQLTDNLRLVALSALGRGRERRTILVVFRSWADWSDYTSYRKAVGTRAIKRMRHGLQAKVWRSWMGWAAAKQMEERIEEIYEQAKADAGTGGDDSTHESLEPGRRTMDSMDDDDDDEEGLDRDSPTMPDDMGITAADMGTRAVQAPVSAAEAIQASALSSGRHGTVDPAVDGAVAQLSADADQELKSLQAAYNLAAVGLDGVRALVQTALSPAQETSTLAACKARHAVHGLVAAVAPRPVAAEIAPLLVLAMVECGVAAGRENAAFVLGELGLVGASADVVAALINAVVGRDGRPTSQDSCELVRSACCDAMGNIATAVLADGSSELLAELEHRIVGTLTIALHTDPSGRVLFAAATALARLGGAAMPAMSVLAERAASCDDRYARSAALEALRRLNSGQANSLLVNKLLMPQRWCSLTSSSDKH